MSTSRVHRWLSGLIAGAVMVAGILGAPSGVTAGPHPTTELPSREGDNTIYLTWDANDGRVTEATSSRRLSADQKVELLTKIIDRTGRIVMRAVLENISESHKYRIRGRLVHRVWRDDEVVKTLQSRRFRLMLGPGEQIGGRFTYRLASGEYSARTDFVTE